MRSRLDAAEWVQGHLAEAIRIATLLTADPERGPRVAEESLDAALELVPRRRRDGRLGDALLAQLVRHSRADTPASEEDLPDQLAALAALPRRQRAALVLRYYTELSDERAAVFLDCSPRAVADLATRAVAALPPEARADVHDWLDSTPLPRPVATQPRKTLLRRVLRPRVLRAAAALTAVAAGVAGGMRLPGLTSAPEPPSAADRVAEIRQVLELREASLPFDPDDPGPGASRMFPVVDGVVGGNLWSVAGYRDQSGAPCLQLVVAYEFGRRRCLDAGDSPIFAVLDVDREHDATFISGMVDPRIRHLHFVGPEVSWMDVTIGRQDPQAPGGSQPGFFGIALPDEFVAVDSLEARRDGGYRVLRGWLTGEDERGKAVARLRLLLART